MKKIILLFCILLFGSTLIAQTAVPTYEECVEVIEKMNKNLKDNPPSLDEGFDRIITIR